MRYKLAKAGTYYKVGDDLLTPEEYEKHLAKQKSKKSKESDK